MIEQLREAINTRLQLARAATPGPWSTPGPDTIAEWSIYADDRGWMVASASVNDYPDAAPRLRGGITGDEANRNAAHIAANDPSTVERHCLADLAILDLHKPWNFGQDGEEDHCGVCMQLRDNEWRFLHSPCPTLAALAEAYGVDLAGRSEESP